MIRRKRLRKLDDRVAEAERERVLSRWRAAFFREHVFGPLAEAGDHNGFAEILKDSLMEGHQK